jgi:hypothetical protein
MMKKLLVFMMVLGMATMANATVIDVVTVGEGDMGNAGTELDPLDIGESIEIKLLLNFNLAPHPPQDGYLLSSLDVTINVSGGGEMDAGFWYYGAPIWQKHGQFSPFVVNDSYDATEWDSIDDGLDQVTGVAMDPIYPATTAGADLVWDLIITATSTTDITIDLVAGTTELGGGEYSPYSDITRDQPKPDPPGWVAMTNGDLGDLTIYTVPEPTTVALLGLGGLLLLRRRK